MSTAEHHDAGHEHGELVSLRRIISEYRQTVVRKTRGLNAEQLARRSVPPSTLSLLGLLRHLAQMEHYWFVLTLQRRDEEQLYVPGGDWDAQFRDAVADEAVVDDAFTTWRSVAGGTDALLDRLEQADLDIVVNPQGSIATVRDVLHQVVKEYARHCGHLDLLREAIDGATGE